MSQGARVLQVIETTLARRGNGQTTPVRPVTQYWSLDGTLLAERDDLLHKRLAEARAVLDVLCADAAFRRLQGHELHDRLVELRLALTEDGV